MSNSQPFKAYKALNYAILIIIFYPSPHFFVIDKKRPPPWLNQNGGLKTGPDSSISCVREVRSRRLASDSLRIVYQYHPCGTCSQIRLFGARKQLSLHHRCGTP